VVQHGFNKSHSCLFNLALPPRCVLWICATVILVCSTGCVNGPSLNANAGRAKVPILVNSGASFPDTNGQLIGTLEQYCTDTNIHQSGVRGLYLNLDFPTFTTLKAKFNGQLLTLLESAPEPKNAFEGPRYQSMNYWDDEDHVDSTNTLLHERVAVVLPVTPWSGTLALWTESQVQDRTGADKVSAPLELNVGSPPVITSFTVNNGAASIVEGDHLIFQVNGNVRTFSVSGDGIQGSVQVSIAQQSTPNVTARCLTPGRTSETLHWTATASRTGCASVTNDISALLLPFKYATFTSTGNPLAVTVGPNSFGIADNQSYTLTWNSPWSAGPNLTISGPGLVGAQTFPKTGTKTFPARRTPFGQEVEELVYTLSDNIVGGCRSVETQTLTVVNQAVWFPFSFAVTCTDPIRPSCVDHTQGGHDSNEALQITQNLYGGCQVRAGHCP
jgi:hypothetical protein